MLLPSRNPGYLVLFIIVFVLTGGFQPTFGAEISLESLVRQVQLTYEETRDWEADFQQTVAISGFDSPIRSRGHLFIKKPGELRLDYQEPSQDQIMVRENTIWFYTPELKQVIVSSFGEITDSRLPIHLLAGTGRLDKDFTIEWAKNANPSGAEKETPGRSLKLTPKDTETEISSLRLTIHPENNMITGLTLYEKNGNHSRFTFSKIHTNTGLKDRLFIFKAPKGVVTIESSLGSSN